MADPREYTVGWICAITTESVAARAFLDKEHARPGHVDPNDNNNYVLGQIGSHNIVIAVLPDGEYGTTSAAAVARDMLRTFPNIRIGLMVGIGGGAPTSAHDIRLGDVVVSSPGGGIGGVFQYDFGKTIQDQEFRETGFLNQPPTVLRAAVSALRGTYELKGHRLADDAEKALKMIKKRKKYARPAPTRDRLYRSDYVHPPNTDSCDICDVGHLVARDERNEEDDDPAIYYGLIASGNQLMKDARVRDKLAAEKGVLCFEMEAAGLMNHFPCLVIRGICDYADSHKSKEWQGFAAMMAAAYARDLLQQIPPNRIEAERPITETIDAIKHQIGHVEQTTSATKVAVDHIRSDHHTEKIKDWLQPPDPSTNANHARKLRCEKTGMWLLEHTMFQSWKSGSPKHLWLHGLAGCGKTVLSAGVLEALSQADDRLVLTFFFDFSDMRKQTVDGMLRSLAFQLYPSTATSTALLDALFKANDAGLRQPTAKALSDVVFKMLNDNARVCIVLDALDESTTRSELLAWLKDVASTPELGHVQLLCTGRPEPEFLTRIPCAIGRENCMSLDNTGVNADIRAYVAAQLAARPEFQDKYLAQDLVEEIKARVGDGADGMFRWAACQMDSLAGCPSPKAIRNALKCLPQDLSETYARMISNIPQNLRDDAMRLLQFLVHTPRPLTVTEAVEVIATDTTAESGGFDEDARVFGDNEVLRHCPSLISIVEMRENRGSWGRSQFWGNTKKELHLSHFSVKEFLTLRADFQQPASGVVIAKTCLTYLAGIDGDHETVGDDYPMARLAAEIWTSHAAWAQSHDDVFQATLTFLDDEKTFQRWGHLYQADFEDNIWMGPGPPEGSRLYYACLGGLMRVAQELIDRGAEVNGQGGRFGNALQAASHEGHDSIVQLLLQRGANINAHGGEYDNALQAASYRGRTAITKLLLQKGIDINRDGGHFGNPAQAASCGGHLDILELLIESGADVSVQGGVYGTALQAAAFEGHLHIAKLLLEKGVDINVQRGKYNTALQAASRKGHGDIVQLLLQKEADMNAVGGRHGTALQAASDGGHYEIVRLLLQKGAGVNVQGGAYGNALQAASDGGHLEIVDLLLKRGADVNAQTKHFDANALHAASRKGYIDVVKLLLEYGADVNTQKGHFGNPLQAASYIGHDDVVKLLLRKGAHINAQGGRFGSALYAAVCRGRMDTASLLLENGANANTNSGSFHVIRSRSHAGEYGNALHAAAWKGHYDLVKLLLEKGADVNVQGGTYHSALQAASYGGNSDIIKLLLQKGADINAQGGRYGNALQAASSQGYGDIVKLLNAASASLSRRKRPASPSPGNCPKRIC